MLWNFGIEQIMHLNKNFKRLALKYFFITFGVLTQNSIRDEKRIKGLHLSILENEELKDFIFLLWTSKN